jgi:hypothetical protein
MTSIENRFSIPAISRLIMSSHQLTPNAINVRARVRL